MYWMRIFGCTAVFVMMMLSSLTYAEKKNTARSQLEKEAIQMGMDYFSYMNYQYQKSLQSQSARSDSRVYDNLDDGGATSGTAAVIPSTPYLDNGTTVGKGDDASLPTCVGSGNDTAEDAWYVVTFANPVLLTVWTTCASSGPPSYDTRLGLFNQSLTLLICNDDDPNCGSPNYQSRISGYALCPGTYYIAVDGFDGTEGPYQFNATWITNPNPNCGSCGSYTDLGSSLGNVSNGSTVGGTNVFSAQGLGSTAPACWLDYYNQAQSSSGPDKTFHWIVPATAGYNFSLCGSNFDTGILIYDFTCPTAPQNPADYVCGNDDDPSNACGVDSYIECLQLTAGQELFVVVDGWNGASGTYILTITQCSAPCDGSDAGTATAIPALPYVHNGSTVNECNDIDPSACGASSSSPDFWYSLNLNADVELTAYTLCSAGSFNTKLAVLSSGLTQLTCNDDAVGCATLQSRIEDYLLPPGNYYIVVDGANGQEGTYELHVDTVHVSAPGVTDLLPDIIVRDDELYDNDIQGNLLRMSNGTANIGLGRLHLFGGQDNGNGTQEVIQRIFRTDGSTWERVAGSFVFHPTHSHIHVEDWCTYRLREILPGNGVGDVIATGEKTSFCILDLGVYDSGLPNFAGSHYNSCSSTTQGLSVGYIDIYGKTLAGQNIDITGIPGGAYWLESEVDPNNNILESDEANNITRIQVTIAGGPPGIDPDAYEINNSTGETLARLEGAVNSPNLGPCNPQKVVTGLNIHAANNEDFFRLYSNHTGGAGDFVRVDFLNSQGDIDMRLLNSLGTEVAASNGTGNQENITLNGRTEGYYYLRIFGYNGATNPDYTLTIDPPSNGAPSVTVVNPPAGDVVRIHGTETYDATWTFSDPESDLGWVTLYMNTTPAFNGSEILLATSLNTLASVGVHTINSAYVPIGTYWVYASATDGGTTVGDWSTGTVSFVDPIPDPIEDLTIYPSGNDIILRWGIPLDGSHHFAIYTRDSSGGPATPLDEVVDAYSYTHVGGANVADLKFYYIVVVGD